MRLGRNKGPAVVGERLAHVLEASCIGSKCVNWSGVECSASEELLHADGESASLDLPPLRADATFAIYGLVCGKEEKASLAGIRAMALDSAVNSAELVALADLYGDLPQHISGLSHDGTPSPTFGVETLFSSAIEPSP